MLLRDRPTGGLPGIPGSGAPPAPTTPPRRSGEPHQPGAGTIRVFVLAMIIAIAGLTISGERRRLADPVEQAGRGEIGTYDALSFLREERLERGLAAVAAAAPGTTISSLRITPTTLGATVGHPDGRREHLRLDAALAVTRSDFGASPENGVDAADIPTAVPRLLVSRAATKLKLVPEHLDYVLLMVSGSTDHQEPVTATWGLYYSDPPLDNDATAALDGTDLRLIGEPDAAARALKRKVERQAAKTRAAIRAFDAEQQRITHTPTRTR